MLPSRRIKGSYDDEAAKKLLGGGGRGDRSGVGEGCRAQGIRRSIRQGGNIRSGRG